MPITNKGGRPAGRLIHAEGFEAIAAARKLLKKDVAALAEVSPGYLADLLAHRCGASDATAERIATALGCTVAALFPEAAGWIAPLPDRDAKRTINPSGAAA
jgi:transcriptional regulator with XRE-family HTH domain